MNFNMFKQFNNCKFIWNAVDPYTKTTVLVDQVNVLQGSHLINSADTSCISYQMLLLNWWVFCLQMQRDVPSAA